jgi:hypothetical protein
LCTAVLSLGGERIKVWRRLGPTRPRTVKGLDLLQEPLQPCSIESLRDQLRERAGYVHARVMRELSPLDELEEDGVFQTCQNIADAVKREGIGGYEVVGLHRSGICLVGRGARFGLGGNMAKVET